MAGLRSLDVFILIFNILIVLALAFIVVYGFVLFVKLSRRGIKALDLYINEKKNGKTANVVAEPKQIAGVSTRIEVPAHNRGELSAVIAASIASVMGTDVAGIRIVSCRRIS